MACWIALDVSTILVASSIIEPTNCDTAVATMPIGPANLASSGNFERKADLPASIRLAPILFRFAPTAFAGLSKSNILPASLAPSLAASSRCLLIFSELLSILVCIFCCSSNNLFFSFSFLLYSSESLFRVSSSASTALNFAFAKLF